MSARDFDSEELQLSGILGFPMNFAIMDFSSKSVSVLASTVARSEDILASKTSWQLSMAIILAGTLPENPYNVDLLVHTTLLDGYGTTKQLKLRL